MGSFSIKKNIITKYCALALVTVCNIIKHKTSYCKKNIYYTEINYSTRKSKYRKVKKVRYLAKIDAHHKTHSRGALSWTDESQPVERCHRNEF